MINAVTSFFTAASSLLRMLPIWWQHQIANEIDNIEDEIVRLADSGDPSDKLRIEHLYKRKKRATESLGALRSANDNADSE